MEYLLITVVIFASIIFYANRRKKRAELKKLHNQQRKEILPYLSQILEFDNHFKKFKSKHKYLSNFEVFNFKEESKHLFNTIKNKEYKHLPDFDFEINQINTFINTFENLDTILALRNESFINPEIKETDKLLSKANEKIIAINCEWCDNGKFIERNGPYGLFYACNNSHYCNFTRKIESNDYRILANKFYEVEDFEKAIEFFEKYLSIESGNSETYYELGRSYEERKDLEKALLNYDKSISLNESNAYAYYWRASTHFDLNNYQNSIDDWLQFHSLSPNSNYVNYWLAQAYYKSRYFIKSIQFLKQEISTNPDNEDAIKLKLQYLSNLKKRFTIKEYIISSSIEEPLVGYLKLAIDFKLNVKFSYHKSMQFGGGVQSLRTIKPKGIKMMGRYNSLCLYGYCYMREEERTFNIDRISDLKINPEEIEFWSN